MKVICGSSLIPVYLLVVAAWLAMVVRPRDWSLEQQRGRQGRQAPNVRFLIIFIGSVFLFCLFLLATAKGRVADGIPIPSCRPSVVECFVCIFCLAHCCGQRKFTVSNDTSCVEVLSLFQSGFNY